MEMRNETDVQFPRIEGADSIRESGIRLPHHANANIREVGVVSGDEREARSLPIGRRSGSAGSEDKTKEALVIRRWILDRLRGGLMEKDECR